MWLIINIIILHTSTSLALDHIIASQGVKFLMIYQYITSSFIRLAHDTQVLLKRKRKRKRIKNIDFIVNGTRFSSTCEWCDGRELCGCNSCLRRSQPCWAVPLSSAGPTLCGPYFYFLVKSICHDNISNHRCFWLCFYLNYKKAMSFVHCW